LAYQIMTRQTTEASLRTVHIRPVIGLSIQLTLLALIAARVGLSGVGWVVGITCGLIANVVLARGLANHGADGMGPAGGVTLARAMLNCAVAALTADSFWRPISVTTLVGLAVVALLLDGVDGQVARRTGTVTALGARFDMEVDAFLILVLSVYVARSTGPWVLVIGAARYLFVAAAWLLPWLRETAPPRYWGKVVAATQGVVLTVSAADILPHRVVVVALVGALALLVESFGREALWLWQHRPVESRRSVTHPPAQQAQQRQLRQPRVVQRCAARVDVGHG
jgi:phosphatidylglycerophosphate synthase